MANEKKPLTLSEMARLCKRTVVTTVTDKDGVTSEVEKQVAIREKEVISAKEYADRVVVVTEDGQKFEAALV